MKGFTVNIKGFQEVKEDLKNIPKLVESEVQKRLNEFGLKTVNDAKRLAPVDEGHLRNSISFVKQKLKVNIVVAANYAAYVEFGTRKFAASYVASLPQDWQKFAAKFKGAAGGGNFEDFVMRIMDWVKRKGISGTYSVKTKKRTKASGTGQDFEDAEVAYGIALSIIRKGTRPHPFLFPAIEKNKIELVNELKELFK